MLFAQECTDLVLEVAAFGRVFDALVHDGEGDEVACGALCGVANECADGIDSACFGVYVGGSGCA